MRGMKMTVNNNVEGVLNRKKTQGSSNSNFEASMKAIETETINGALATQFPEWDLKPPANLVRRKSTKLS